MSDKEIERKCLCGHERFNHYNQTGVCMADCPLECPIWRPQPKGRGTDTRCPECGRADKSAPCSTCNPVDQPKESEAISQIQCACGIESYHPNQPKETDELISTDSYSHETVRKEDPVLRKQLKAIVGQLNYEPEFDGDHRYTGMHEVNQRQVLSLLYSAIQEHTRRELLAEVIMAGKYLPNIYETRHHLEARIQELSK